MGAEKAKKLSPRDGICWRCAVRGACGRSFRMAAYGEDFSAILEQPVEHVGGEEGRGRAEGFAEGVANPAGFADGLDEDGEGDAADKVALCGFQFQRGSWDPDWLRRSPVNRGARCVPIAAIVVWRTDWWCCPGGWCIALMARECRRRIRCSRAARPQFPISHRSPYLLS